MITKKQKLLAIVLTFFMIFGSMSLTACSLFGPSENDIEILDEQLKIVNGTSGLALYVKIKNKSSSSIKTSFNVNIYKDGEVIDSTYSGVLSLGPGDVGTLNSITSIYNITGNRYSGYTYKITKWNFY